MVQTFKLQKLSSKSTFEEKLDYCLHESRIPSQLSKEEARFQVLNRITGSVKQQSPTIPVFLKVAAAFLVLVVGSFTAFYFIGIEVLENKSSGVAEYLLPDGSIVKLNQNSEASYNSATWFFNRNVNLDSGEAFFEVEKGGKFSVATPMGDIAVLGTSFNVSLRNENFQVACKTGKVEVRLAGDIDPLMLTPGTGLDLAISKTEPVEIQAAKIGVWTLGEFTFENVLVTEVFETIHTQTDYTFEIPEGIDSKYTGQFNLNQSMEEILDIICIPSNLTYSIDPVAKKISITKI